MDKINKQRSRSETRQTVFFFINSITRAFSALFMVPLVELYIKVIKLLSLTPPINFSVGVLGVSRVSFVGWVCLSGLYFGVCALVYAFLACLPMRHPTDSLAKYHDEIVTV